MEMKSGSVEASPCRSPLCLGSPVGGVCSFLLSHWPQTGAFWHLCQAELGSVEKHIL